MSLNRFGWRKSMILPPTYPVTATWVVLLVGENGTECRPLPPPVWIIGPNLHNESNYFLQKLLTQNRSQWPLSLWITVGFISLWIPNTFPIDSFKTLALSSSKESLIIGQLHAINAAWICWDFKFLAALEA